MGFGLGENKYVKKLFLIGCTCRLSISVFLSRDTRCCCGGGRFVVSGRASACAC